MGVLVYAVLVGGVSFMSEYISIWSTGSPVGVSHVRGTSECITGWVLTYFSLRVLDVVI